MKTSVEVRKAINSLISDPRIVGRCPACGCRRPLSEWNLFYRENFPTVALDSVGGMRHDLLDLKEAIKEKREAITSGAAQKSVVVKMGKIVEHVAPILTGFPYAQCDCRPLFDPIDYIVFEGLHAKGQVEKLAFVDVKTGEASLSPREEMVKRAVEKVRVGLGLY